MALDHLVESGDDFVELSVMRETIRSRILHTLSIYPYLMPSMLQVGIGTAVSPRIWHPVKDKLLADGVICQDEIRTRSPVGRDQVYTILRLASTPPHTAPHPLSS